MYVCMTTPLRCSGIARILKRSQFYLHTPRSSTNGMNHTCLCLPSQSWYSFTDPRRDGRLSRPQVLHVVPESRICQNSAGWRQMLLLFINTSDVELMALWIPLESIQRHLSVKHLNHVSTIMSAL